MPKQSRPVNAGSKGEQVDSSELAGIVAYTSAAWPNLRADEITYEVWFDLLGDLERQAVLACVKEMALEGRSFAPGPGEVRARLFRHINNDPDLDEAWGILQETIRHSGYYGTPEFESQTLADWVNSFGWRQACAEDLMILRAHFYKTYGTTQRRTERVAATPPAVAAVLGSLLRRAPELSEQQRSAEPSELSP
jgi:hypothetical protein